MMTNTYEELLARVTDQYEYICKDIAKAKPVIEFARAVGQEWTKGGTKRSAHVSYSLGAIELHLHISPRDKAIDAYALVQKRCYEHGAEELQRQAERTWSVYFPEQKRRLMVTIFDRWAPGV